MSGYPDDNPKTTIGVTKVPLHLVPPSAKHYLAEAFADGASKYGPYNWREKRVSSSVYVGAAQRHLDAFWDGEDLSSDAKVHHLAHVMACCAIMLDAHSIGMLNDDRPSKGASPKLQQEYVVKKKETNAEYNRQHGTITPYEFLPTSEALGLSLRSSEPGESGADHAHISLRD